MKLAHVLYIESSPRKLRSASIEVAQAALSAWRKADPKLTVDTLDVWSTKLPEFDGPLMEAKYAGLAGTPLTKEQDSAWSALREIAERFLAADALVFAVPLRHSLQAQAPRRLGDAKRSAVQLRRAGLWRLA